MKIQVTAIFFHICYSFGHQSCFENGKDYPGSDIYQNGFWTSDADQCQKLCQNTDSCEFWTWLLDYDGNDGLCYMKYSKAGIVSTFFNLIQILQSNHTFYIHNCHLLVKKVPKLDNTFYLKKAMI